jgi:hypothetical protein
LSITTATELKTALTNWSKRSDLSTRYDEFIALFEARANRFLRTKGMENAMTTTALTDGAVTNPTGFIAWKELRYDGSPAYTLQPRPIEWIRNQEDLATAPLYFAVSGTETVCWPQTGSVKGTYYKSLDSLASNSSNWLLASHPDAYLFGCLEEIGLYTQHELTGMWAQRAQALLEQIQSTDNANAIGGGPLTVRAR